MSKGNKTTAPSATLAKLRQIAALVQACIDDVETRVPGQSAVGLRPPPPASHSAAVDFDTNERNFVRTHGIHMTGAGKFVLLIAYLSKGDVKKEVQLKDVDRMWSKMTALLGVFNRKYSNDAKEKGWVNTTKKGQYVLQRTWREIFIKS